MSAWYVWCAIGLYPQNPAVRYLDVGAPLFTSVSLHAPDGPTIEILAPRSRDEAAYVDSLRVNGRASNQTLARAAAARHACVSTFGWDAQPNTRWASGTRGSAAVIRNDPALVAARDGSGIRSCGRERVRRGRTAARRLRFEISNRLGTGAGKLTWRAVASRRSSPRRRSRTVADHRRGRKRERSTCASPRMADLPPDTTTCRSTAVAANGALLAHLAVDRARDQGRSAAVGLR